MVTILLVVFVAAYAAIIFEHFLKIDKAASALFAGVLCWAVYIVYQSADTSPVLAQLGEHLSDISGILFFLIGAMTIVEVIDLHNGFYFITSRIKTHDKRKLLWIIGVISFFLSAVLDNLTTTIVMVSLLPKLISGRNDRLFFASIVIIAANAGGAWTPIGDVTTTMLWIGKQISAGAVMTELFIPSCVALLVPLIAFSFLLKGKVEPPAENEHSSYLQLPPKLRTTMFFIGISLLLFVPIFKTVTHLPPYMGMMLSLSILWIYTELLYRKRGYVLKNRFSLFKALRRVNMTTILFFLGILLCISALQSTGVLNSLSGWLSERISNQNVMVLLIGVISSIVDNVPLVAAAQAMYSYPMDDPFWILLSYAAGTGGSLLIIGSAAGVAAMGLEKIDFIWYAKHVTFWVLLGYLAGALTFLVQSVLFFD
jgi:Na+/H+ antiporter NhaD/arsenite permease-like protein